MSIPSRGVGPERLSVRGGIQELVGQSHFARDDPDGDSRSEHPGCPCSEQSGCPCSEYFECHCPGDHYATGSGHRYGGSDGVVLGSSLGVADPDCPMGGVDRWGDVGSISGATSSTYAFAAPIGDSGFEFAAVFSNAGGSVTSSPATLTVTPLPAGPAVIANPTSTSVAAGQTASFSASASGSPTPTVQWEESTNGATWSPISGATTAVYSFVTAYPENGYRFEAVFTNAIGTATTSAATLTVTPLLHR